MNVKGVFVYRKIFNSKGLNVLLENIEKHNEKVRESLIEGMKVLTGRFFTFRKPKGLYNNLFIFFEEGKFILGSGEISVDKGDIIISEKEPLKKPVSIHLYEEINNCLEKIYLTTEQRLNYQQRVKNSLLSVKKLKIGEQCLQNFFKLTKKIGVGCYGNVYESNQSLKYAIKISKMKEECYRHICNPNYSSWHEPVFLQLFSRSVKEKWCPNLPLLYDIFVCKSCELILEKNKQNSPCISMVVELASGNLKKFLEEKRSLDELHSCLFQIAAALYVIQNKFQIMNYDVKKENILFYDVKPGGYWVYNIRNKEYWVPNYGKLFILNDFGISRSMSPIYVMYKNEKEPVYRLGSRYAVIKDKEFIPFSVKDVKKENKKERKVSFSGKKIKGGEFHIDRENGKLISRKIIMPVKGKKYLKELNIDINSLDFFSHPDIIPPFEFYNDTQDMIRMFTGGKRTTQKGDHKSMPLMNEEFIKQLSPFVGKGESLKDKKFTFPNQVLSAYFIEDFFSQNTNYLVKKDEKEIIERFRV